MIQAEYKKLSLRKNDQVQVIAGRDKGKTGKILQIHLKTGRVTVEKVNLVKRHTRPTQKSTGGIVEKELPLHYSNVLIFCQKCNRGVRHSHQFKANDSTQSTKLGGAKKVRQKKIRVCKRCKESLDLV
jgi:large subunit ribosomal protein L24